MSRAVLLALVVCAGCPSNEPGECTTDADCGADLCTRNGECHPASEVYAVKVTWTIHGVAASPETCAQTPDFYLQFDASEISDVFGYAPVPCDAGEFSIDKLPTRFTEVELGVDDRFNELAPIDPLTGLATFDLSP